MSDGQFYALLGVIASGLSGLAVVIRWSVNTMLGVVRDNTKAMITNTASNAVLSTKIDTISVFVERMTPARGTKLRPPTGG